MPTLTKLYTMQEAAQHNTPQDCWVVIDGKVYDVGSYLDEHPGGDDVILATTGKDATDEFEDAGHSKSARELLETFFIGLVAYQGPRLLGARREVEGLDARRMILCIVHP
ncbi:cytochrome b5 isoform X2 [Populus nigra]|uniref:cytochrome b5 isoform X2 n=1 Tax=Populus nigra TaxID=3691 RepID=UPI002B27272C|nr:cytochrome b5 isoform X2 [Populus nigra]